MIEKDDDALRMDRCGSLRCLLDDLSWAIWRDAKGEFFHSSYPNMTAVDVMIEWHRKNNWPEP